jgi:hypothetical protein
MDKFEMSKLRNLCNEFCESALTDKLTVKVGGVSNLIKSCT